MKQQLLLLLTCLLTLSAAAQIPKDHISGTVKDARTGEAIIGATVMIKGTSNGVTTDYEGSFQLHNKVPMPFTLVISYISYQSVELVVKDHKPIHVRLKENTRELKEVAIKDTRISMRQKQAPLTVETMDALAIKETPAANFYEGLSHLKGVDLTSASIGFKIINTRGFNSTSPVRSLQLIDGVDNQSPGLNFSLGNFLGASELDVQKVDLIVGASGAYYGPNAFNGVIQMQTKSPFLYPGLSAQFKVGERRLLEVGIRYAEVFKDKKGEDKFAYKFNLFAMSARDWEATNYEKTIQSPVDERNPGGYDAVNVYGDEYSNARFNQSGLSYLGFGNIMRKGYRETDLVDYNSRNLKLGLSLHYRPAKDHEIIWSSSMGGGTTVYQGDNRFSLKDILFFQHRAEWRKEGSFFVRAYMTKEDAGNSYDAYATALLLQKAAKSDDDWAKDYAENWNGISSGVMYSMVPKPWTLPPGVTLNEGYVNHYLHNFFYDTLVRYHGLVRDVTDQKPSLQTGGLPRFEPGTARFDSAFSEIISRTNQDGGSRFFDQSALYHIMGEKSLHFGDLEIRMGANYRLYAPFSKGTIFLDTVGANPIRNHEAGAYVGLEHKFLDNALKVSVTNRFDKNQNFNLLWSPAASFVYTKGQHVFRFSAASAIRNPTLTDQYIHLNVGRATLLGNLEGFKNLVTVESLINAFNSGSKTDLRYFDIAPIKPEQVKTLEVGYRGTLLEKLFVDVSYYHSWYTNFIGYKIGVDVDWTLLYPSNARVYRVSANAVDEVTTQGLSIGANYFFRKYLGFACNYSWNELNRHGSADPLIPAFNTPLHKYNIGINGRDIDGNVGSFKFNHWGYSINWKWQEGFTFEGSPQFTGIVPAYGMLDVQLSKQLPEEKMTLKMGASNLLDNRVIQVYGGPRVGRMIYASILFDFGK